MSKSTVGSERDVLSIEVRTQEGRAVCYLAGELDSISGPALRVVLNERLDSGQDAVVDLSAVTFIDSSGIGVLVGALKRFQATNHQLSLRGPSAPIRRVLDMTGLTGAFSVE